MLKKPKTTKTNQPTTTKKKTTPASDTKISLALVEGGKVGGLVLPQPPRGAALAPAGSPLPRCSPAGPGGDRDPGLSRRERGEGEVSRVAGSDTAKTVSEWNREGLV